MGKVIKKYIHDENGNVRVVAEQYEDFNNSRKYGSDYSKDQYRYNLAHMKWKKR